MYLFFGDVHLKNEISDKYYIIFDHIVNIIKIMDLYEHIHKIVFLGDIFDCEYISYKKLLYFYNFITYIKNSFNTKNVSIVIGNHDKYSMVDGDNNNLLKYITTDEIIFKPTLDENGILFLPHFYDKSRIDMSTFSSCDVHLIAAHAGPAQYFGNTELTSDDISQYFPQAKKIYGHLHLARIEPPNSVFLGTLRADSFHDAGFGTYIVVYDKSDKNLISIFVPYKKIFHTINVTDEKEFKDDIIKLFNKIYKLNTNLIYYLNENKHYHESKVSWFTDTLILKIILKNTKILPKNLHAILDLAKRESDIDLKINPIININIENNITNKENENPLIKKDDCNQIQTELNIIINNILTNNLISDQTLKKLKKLNITNKEKIIFSEYINYIDMKNEFSKIKKYFIQNKK